MGALHVNAYADTAEEQGRQFALVWIYTESGLKIPGPELKDAWSVGIPIQLEPGVYWVGIGTEESKSNLYRYEVVDKKTTAVPTGWVIVNTIPAESRPVDGCNDWNATLTASVLDAQSIRTTVASNKASQPNADGAIQLHPGQYIVNFHHFSTLVQVEAGEAFRPATGYFDPSDSPEQFLILKVGDDPYKVGLPVCRDGQMHTLAGDYFFSEAVVSKDGDIVDRFVQPVTIDPDEFGTGYKKLRGDKIKKKRKPGKDEGRLISPEELELLTDWGNKRSPFADIEMKGL